MITATGAFIFLFLFAVAIIVKYYEMFSENKSQIENKKIKYDAYSDIVENGQIVKFHEKFINDIFNNGYTYMTLRRADEVVEYYKTHECDNIFCYKDFILYAADFCNIKGDYKYAYDFLSNLNSDILMHDDLTGLDEYESIFKFWALKMETLRGLGDIKSSEDMLKEASQFWDNKYILNDINRFWKDVCYYHYYMLMDGYILMDAKEKARSCADRLFMYHTNGNLDVLACILNAEVMYSMDDKEEALDMMKFSSSKLQNKKLYPVQHNYLGHIEQRYRKYMKKFGFDN